MVADFELAGSKSLQGTQLAAGVASTSWTSSTVGLPSGISLSIVKEKSVPTRSHALGESSALEKTEIGVFTGRSTYTRLELEKERSPINNLARLWNPGLLPIRSV